MNRLNYYNSQKRIIKHINSVVPTLLRLLHHLPETRILPSVNIINTGRYKFINSIQKSWGTFPTPLPKSLSPSEELYKRLKFEKQIRNTTF